MVQCTGTAKSTGQRCRITVSEGESRCHHHQTCRGNKPDGTPCGSKRNPNYDGYCGTSHDPRKNTFKPTQFRDEDVMEMLRPRVRKDGVDVYTHSTLDRAVGQCDHYVELQVAANVLNHVDRVYDGYGDVEDTIPIVKEYINNESNLGFTHKDINKLKGAAMTNYLNGIAYELDVSWTTSLLNAHEQLNPFDRNTMQVKRLKRAVTSEITKNVASQMKKLYRNLEDEVDDCAMECVAERLRFLTVRMKK